MDNCEIISVRKINPQKNNGIQKGKEASDNDVESLTDEKFEANDKDIHEFEDNYNTINEDLFSLFDDDVDDLLENELEENSKDTIQGFYINGNASINNNTTLNRYTDNKKLLREYENTNSNDVLEFLLEANQKLVIKEANKYYGSVMHTCIDIDDLIQEGMLGLIKAIDRFDFHKGFELSTYATWWIRQSITRYIANNANTVRMPIHLVEQIKKLQRLERIAEMSGISIKDKINAYGYAEDISLKKYNELKFYERAYWRISSLDLPIGEDSDSVLIDFIPSDPNERSLEEEVMDNAERDMLIKHIKQLPPRSSKVIVLRFGLQDGKPRTLEEIGQMFGLTRERIRQIESKALGKLKRWIIFEQSSSKNKKIRYKGLGI